MDELKIVGFAILLVILLVASILGIVGGSIHLSNMSKDKEWARTIECKQIGGVWTYENYDWYCK
jgi:hypothetical protein